MFDELELRRRGLRWIADPNLWIPFGDGTSLGQFIDDARTQADLDRLGLSAADIDGYWSYHRIFDDVRKLLREGEHDAWEGDSPTRPEIESMLGGNQAMIDLVFEAAIAGSWQTILAGVFGRALRRRVIDIGATRAPPRSS